MSRTQTLTARVRGVGLVLVATLAVAAVTSLSALAWIHRTFPGFMLLENRVVASVSLPWWSVVRAPEVFQATVVEVEGVHVTSAEQVYARVAARPPGTPLNYTFSRDGVTFGRVLESRSFTWSDGFLLFGAYLLNGLLFAAIGLGICVATAEAATRGALLALGLCASAYALTAMDLYGPYLFFRLHALAESLLPATVLHLALIFPVRRIRVRRALVVCYLPAVVLAVVYQAWLMSPTLYPHVHALAAVALSATGFFLVWSALSGYLRSSSELVRQRVRFVVFGLIAGLGIPLPLAVLSVLEGTPVPANVMAYTAFVFPLSIAYAVHKRDLFEIDALVQRGLYYAVLTGLVTAAYLLVAAFTSHFLQVSFGKSPAFSLVFTIVVLLVMPSLRDWVQRLVDVVFRRRTYDAQEVLAAASTALGGTLKLQDILDLTLAFPESALGLERVAVFLRTEQDFVETARRPGNAATTLDRLPAGRPLLRVLARLPHVLIRDTPLLDTAVEHAAALEDFDNLGAELIVPLTCQGDLIGFLVCGRKAAGTFFTATDVSFLRTFANHAALSLQNARTFHDLHLLNTDLERRVDERTRHLEAAYATLQSSQEQLIAAQKMAAFGRLAAQIAHEMNTPLGAALNHLKTASEIVGECEAMAADPTTPDAERREHFAFLAKLVNDVGDWTRKAVDYVRSVKSHGRADGGPLAAFDVGRLIERDLKPLLMHRLRLAGGALDLQIAHAIPELYGDSGRLAQVLANLINNAIDACEGLPPERCRIAVQVEPEAADVVVRVSDRGTGIPEQTRPRIFDEFYTTKPPGKGTGLGLSIARDIVSGEFGGTLACTASGPEGTTFTIRLPVPFSARGHHEEECETSTVTGQPSREELACQAA